MATVTVNVSGMEGVLKALEKFKELKGSVKAGVLEGATGDEGKSVLDYAPIQEFGGQIPVTKKMRGFLAAAFGVHLKKTTTVINIPSRPFLRSTYAENKEKWNAVARGMSASNALEAVGGEMQLDIIEKIKSSMPPPNSPMTTKIKQEKAPAVVGQTLQFSGSLLKSILHEVTE